MRPLPPIFRLGRMLPLLLPLLLAPAAGARTPFALAYCDLDHLYDTVPSPFYDDSDHTPAGRYGWNTERYRRKVSLAAAVIDSLSMPFVALWSVENEAVVRDIASASRNDYVYLHRTLNALDGMDFALLYYGDVFFPHYAEPGRRYLYVEGTLRLPPPAPPGHGPRGRVPASTEPPEPDTLGLLLCSEARMARLLLPDLRRDRPGVRIIAMGRLGDDDASSARLARACGLRDAHARAARRGRGNMRLRRGWSMRDRIWADTAFRRVEGDVYMRPFLVDPHTAYPVKTFDQARYEGGYGYALPVFAVVE